MKHFQEFQFFEYCLSFLLLISKAHTTYTNSVGNYTCCPKVWLTDGKYADIKIWSCMFCRYSTLTWFTTALLQFTSVRVYQRCYPHRCIFPHNSTLFHIPVLIMYVDWAMWGLAVSHGNTFLTELPSQRLYRTKLDDSGISTKNQHSHTLGFSSTANTERWFCFLFSTHKSWYTPVVYDKCKIYIQCSYLNLVYWILSIYNVAKEK